MGSKIDIAWTLIGLFGTLSFLAMVLTLSEQWVRSRRLGNTSHTYETVLGATEALIAAEGGPDAERVNGVHGETLRKLLTSSRTSSDAIEALADAARSRPAIAKVLRGRPDVVRSITVWVDEQLASPDNFRRAHAVEVIASLRMRSCRGALAAATNDSDAMVRTSACRALAAIDPNTAVGALLRIVENDGTWAADLLGDLLARGAANDGPGARGRAERTDAQPDASVGGGAGVEEAPEGPEGLEGLEGLEGPDEGSEGRSAFNARLDHWAATPAMLRLADASMPLAAKRALASALEADDPEMRVRAIALLREQPEEHAISGLERLLNDPTEAVKIAVIRALAQFGRAEHALAFAGLVGDPARMVRFAAADALRLLPDGTRLLHVLARSSDVGAAEAATLALWQENAPTHDGPIGDRLHLVSAAPGS